MVTISRSSTYSRGPVTGRARTSMALTLLICCRAQRVGGHVDCINLWARTLPNLTSLPHALHPQPVGLEVDREPGQAETPGSHPAPRHSCHLSLVPRFPSSEISHWCSSHTFQLVLLSNQSQLMIQDQHEALGSGGAFGGLEQTLLLSIRFQKENKH